MIVCYGSGDTLLSTIRVIDTEKTTLDALLVVHSLGHFSCLFITELAETNATAQSGGRVSFESRRKESACFSLQSNDRTYRLQNRSHILFCGSVGDVAHYGVITT